MFAYFPTPDIFHFFRSQNISLMHVYTWQSTEYVVHTARYRTHPNYAVKLWDIPAFSNAGNSHTLTHTQWHTHTYTHTQTHTQMSPTKWTLSCGDPKTALKFQRTLHKVFYWQTNKHVHLHVWKFPNLGVQNEYMLRGMWNNLLMPLYWSDEAKDCRLQSNKTESAHYIALSQSNFEIKHWVYTSCVPLSLNLLRAYI